MDFAGADQVEVVENFHQTRQRYSFLTGLTNRLLTEPHPAGILFKSEDGSRLREGLVVGEEEVEKRAFRKGAMSA